MKTALQLREAYGNLQTEIDGIRLEAEKAGRDLTKEEFELIKAKLDSQDALETQINTAERMEKRTETTSSTQAVPREFLSVRPAAESETYTLGAYLKELVYHAKGNPQPRVVNYQQKITEERRIHAAATGASEIVPSEGGFLVGTDMTTAMVDRAYNNSVIAPRCDRYTITSSANSIEVLGQDETSRANGSRHGGIRHYWIGEAGTPTASKPKWRKDRLTLRKEAVLFYATDELVSDSTLLEQKVNEYVGDEMAFGLQDSLINGDGASKPLGILNAPCLVSVAKETGQAAATIVYENTVKMVARFWGSDANAIWVANRDIFPQLAVMNLAVGTGGAPVWIPANGAAGRPLNILHGYPLVYVEQAATLGTAGDLILCDWSQYRLADKGGVQAAMSVHVEFVDDEIVYRWIYRVDGQPAWNAALTPYKGTNNTRSPFVALAVRS